MKSCALVETQRADDYKHTNMFGSLTVYYPTRLSLIKTVLTHSQSRLHIQVTLLRQSGLIKNAVSTAKGLPYLIRNGAEMQPPLTREIPVSWPRHKQGCSRPHLAGHQILELDRHRQFGVLSSLQHVHQLFERKFLA